MEIEMTKMSSKGQVVIPQDIREHMKATEGTVFAVFGTDDTILLKKMKTPSFDNFEELLKKTQKLIKEKGIRPKDVDEAVKRTRKT